MCDARAHTGSERVEFCGYCVPHPSEKKFHLRVQTKSLSIIMLRSLIFLFRAHCVAENVPAAEVLKDAIDHLTALSDHVLEMFDSALLVHDSLARSS